MSYKELEREKQKTEQILAETQATNEQLQQILQLDKQFKELSNSSVLGYDEEKKMCGVLKNIDGSEGLRL